MLYHCQAVGLQEAKLNVLMSRSSEVGSTVSTGKAHVAILPLQLFVLRHHPGLPVTGIAVEVSSFL